MLREKISQVPCKGLKGWFLRRGYPQRIVEEQMDRAFRLPVKHDTQQNKIESGVSLVVTYNPAFSNLTTTSRKNYNVLYSDVKVRRVFTPSPFVAHRSARKLREFFGEVKSLSIRKNSGFFKMWFQKISGLP